MVNLIVKFIVPGKPVAKARPRFTCNGRVYTPKKTVNYEKLVAACYVKCVDKIKTENPVKLKVAANFEPPKSWSNKKRAAAIGKPKISKPDGDNILKAVKDGLNGIAYHDDSQVYDSRIIKKYAECDCCEIEIEF